MPYLGIFLTDLTMLDTAVKDRLDVSFLLHNKLSGQTSEVAQRFTNKKKH